MSQLKATVVGAGVIGCSVALELRRRGFEVTVVEKEGDAGHGSTSASCGIVRRFYAQPGMVAMAQEASHIWAGWGDYLGPIEDDLAVFRRPGMLFVFPEVTEGIRETLARMEQVGVNARLLTADEVAARFPFLETASFHPPRPVDHPAFFEPTGRRIGGAVFEEDAGYVVSPGLATLNLRRAGEREGVVYLLNREVAAIEKRGEGRFESLTAGGDVFESDVVVNVAGPHSAKVNAMAGVTLPLETRPLRREVHSMRNPRSDEAGATDVPVVGDLDGGVYFRPEPGSPTLIVGTTDPACDDFEWLDDPDADLGGVSELYRQRQCLRLMKRFPEIGMGPARGLAALYDVTVRDWYPIVDRTDLPGYYVAIGTSGSSFKTAPVLGRLAAEIVEANESGRDTDTDPIELDLQRAGVKADTRFLSRHRGKIRTSGTVIG